MSLDDVPVPPAPPWPARLPILEEVRRLVKDVDELGASGIGRATTHVKTLLLRGCGLA